MTARTTPETSRPSTIVRAEATIRRLDHPEAVRELLAPSAAYAAYALAYLDPALFRLSRFYEARLNDKSALLMHARGGLGASTLLLGDGALLSVLLKLHPGPRQTLLTCDPAQVDRTLSSRNLWRPQSMLRLRVDRDSFKPPSSAAAVRALTRADAPELNRLYALEGEGAAHSGQQIEAGAFYGALVRGRLVATAGTHIYSRREGVAVVGNVFTHPDFRGRGLGTAVTAAVTEHVLGDADLVVLNVDPANRTARQIYEKLGYRDAGRLVEAMSTLCHAASPAPLFHRLLGRWRSGTAGVETVVV